jgi:hypothetical protein
MSPSTQQESSSNPLQSVSPLTSTADSSISIKTFRFYPCPPTCHKHVIMTFTIHAKIGEEGTQARQDEKEHHDLVILQ